MLFIDVSVLCTVHAHMLRYRYKMHTVFAMLTVYSWIRLVEKVLIFPETFNLDPDTFRLNGS